jgi:hypothetical protein
MRTPKGTVVVDGIIKDAPSGSRGGKILEGQWKFSTSSEATRAPFDYRSSPWHPACAGYIMNPRSHGMSEMLPLDPQEVSPVFQGYAIDKIGEYSTATTPMSSSAVTPDSAASIASASSTPGEGVAAGIAEGGRALQSFESPIANVQLPIDFENCSHLKFSGYFTMLQKKAPSVDIAEHFVLFFEDKHPSVVPENIKVYGEGTNLYGKFELKGTYSQKTKMVSCRKKYVPSKRHRKRAGSEHYVVPAPVPGASSGRTKSKRSRKASTINKDLGAEHFNQKPRELREGGAIDGSAMGFDINVMIPPPMVAHGSPAPSSTKSVGSGSHRKRGRPRHDSSPSSHSPYTPPAVKEPVPQWHGAHRDDKRQTYEGEYLEGVRHGYGTCVRSNGTMYEGDWAEGLEHGHGILTDAHDQILYEGEFYEGLIHGRGIYYFTHAKPMAKDKRYEYYDGEWKENMRHGKGRYVEANGNCYEGDWRDNKRCGRGRFR